MNSTEEVTLLQRYVIDGGWMMIFLVPMALLLVAFTVQAAINLRRTRVAPANFRQRLPQILAQCRSRREVEAALEREGHSLALILRRVLVHLEFKPDADPAEILSETIEEECTSLQQRNSQLAVVYTVAPLMGLLGTVFGMIETFNNFAQSTDPSVKELSAGINVALITTAWGLSIAIPAFIFLYFFTRRINTYEQVILPEEGHLSLEPVLSAVGFKQRASSAQTTVRPSATHQRPQQPQPVAAPPQQQPPAPQQTPQGNG